MGFLVQKNPHQFDKVEYQKKGFIKRWSRACIDVRFHVPKYRQRLLSHNFARKFQTWTWFFKIDSWWINLSRWEISWSFLEILSQVDQSGGIWWAYRRQCIWHQNLNLTPPCKSCISCWSFKETLWNFSVWKINSSRFNLKKPCSSLIFFFRVMTQ